MKPIKKTKWVHHFHHVLWATDGDKFFATPAFTRQIARVRKAATAPDRWEIHFYDGIGSGSYTPIEGAYDTAEEAKAAHGPYPTKEEAQAVALATIRLEQGGNV